MDESNHGNFPEFFVATFSTFPQDLHYTKKLKKKHHHKESFLDNLSRDYTFLLATSEDQNYIRQKSPQKLWGIVASSLLKEVPLVLPEKKTNFLVDGPVSNLEKKYIRHLISELYGIHIRKIFVESGAHLDERYVPVNLADKLANFFYKCYMKGEKSSEYQEHTEHNPHRRTLLTSIA